MLVLDLSVPLLDTQLTMSSVQVSAVRGTILAYIQVNNGAMKVKI